MDLSLITVADFKAHFVRDFSYGATSDKVMDADISKAMSEAQITFNQALFPDDAAVRMGYYYLTAHYLVIDLQNAAAGLSGTASNPVSSRSVGSVSESYAIPESYLKNPVLAFISKTGYGQKYLSMVLPRMVGNMASVAGWTNP